MKLLGPFDMTSLGTKVSNLTYDIPGWADLVVYHFNRVHYKRRKLPYTHILYNFISSVVDQGVSIRLARTIVVSFPIDKQSYCAYLSKILQSKFEEAGWGAVDVQFKKSWIFRDPKVIITSKS